MKIDVNHIFLNLDGTKIPEGPPEMEDVDGKQVEKKIPPFRLRKMCANVLLGSRAEEIKCPRCNTPFEKPETLTGQQKLERYELAMRIHKSPGLVDLGTEDIELLKKRINLFYPSLTCAQAWQVLDPHSEKK